MSRRSRWARVALVSTMLGGVLAVQAPPLGAAPASRSTLSKDDRQRIAAARLNGEATVTLLIAARPGASKQVVSGLQGLGASIGYRDDTLGYVRATVPTGRAEAAANVAGVSAVDLDQIVPLPDPRPDGAAAPNPQIPPSASTPRNNPYMPIAETGAADFTTAHPTWDGRGVTVGIVDTGIALDHPSLATTTTGERKIVDWITATSPTQDGDPTWVNMADVVTGSAFTYKGVGYTAPAATTYRIGLFDERHPLLGGEIGSDVNRDGNPAGTSGIFSVLWDAVTNTVYVDTNQNRSFADELAMTDYKVRADVGTFGTDNPATAIREAMPFVVQTDGKGKFVNIGIVSGAHGSHVAGIVAANAMFGGAMGGAAPGAKLVSIRACLFVAGCTSHALLEGMIYAAKQANVDVINMSIGGLPSLNDGNNARCALYDRLIEQSNVQMFFSAGNSGAGMNTVGDPGVCTKVVSVGSYISKATWQADYGSDSEHVDNLHGFSSRGPTEAGGFKPTIVAPGAAVSTTPLFQDGVPVLGTYALPPGYSMFNGTSMAAPQAAGAAALLVSAAKQSGAQRQPAQLRQAIASSARLLDVARISVYAQGNGLLAVEAAWQLLRRNVPTVEITSTVPVATALSQFFATPGVGTGIYDREGVAAGQTYTRTYTFTRTSGAGGAKRYNVSWVGGGGTFSSPASIVLPKGTPVSLPVRIAPATAGAHSAILNLDDPATPGVDKQTMNVVVAAEDFTAANGYSITKTGSIGRNQTTSYFFRIPAGTPAFQVDFSGPGSAPGTGQARFLRFHPYGVGIDANASTSCYSPAVAAGCNATSRTVANPQAGVWEVVVEARRTSDVASAPYTLTASILGATVSPNPDVISDATIATPVARTYSLTNSFGPFTGRAVGTALGSAVRARPTIANLEQQSTEVMVTAGSTSLRATIGGTSDAAADLDLFVFNCTTGGCVLAGQAADGDSEESVTISNPAAGRWVIVVDGYSVPGGTTTYDYTDVFANPAFGNVSITDANASRASGSSWTVPGTVTANAAPVAGRVLLGSVQVRTSTNTLIGEGDVVVQSVTP